MLTTPTTTKGNAWESAFVDLQDRIYNMYEVSNMDSKPCTKSNIVSLKKWVDSSNNNKQMVVSSIPEVVACVKKQMEMIQMENESMNNHHIVFKTSLNTIKTPQADCFETVECYQEQEQKGMELETDSNEDEDLETDSSEDCYANYNDEDIKIEPAVCAKMMIPKYTVCGEILGDQYMYHEQLSLRPETMKRKSIFVVNVPVKDMVKDVVKDINPLFDTEHANNPWMDLRWKICIDPWIKSTEDRCKMINVRNTKDDTCDIEEMIKDIQSANVQHVLAYDQGWPRIFVVSMKDIQKGEALKCHSCDNIDYYQTGIPVEQRKKDIMSIVWQCEEVKMKHGVTADFNGGSNQDMSQFIPKLNFQCNK